MANMQHGLASKMYRLPIWDTTTIRHQLNRQETI